MILTQLNINSVNCWLLLSSESLRQWPHQCTAYGVQCTVYTVYCILYTVYCILYNIQCTMYTIHRTLYSVQCTLYTVHCTLYTVKLKLYTDERCTVLTGSLFQRHKDGWWSAVVRSVITVHSILYVRYSVYYSPYIVLTVYIVHCPVYTVNCTLKYKVNSSMYSIQAGYIVQCSVYIVQCTVYIVGYTVYSVKCRVALSSNEIYPGAPPPLPTQTEELGSWSFDRMFTPHHVSCVRCQVSGLFFLFFFQKNWWI